MADHGILTIDINDSMMQYVKKLRSIYDIALEKGRENQNEIEKKRAARKRLNADINCLQQDKKVNSILPPML